MDLGFSHLVKSTRNSLSGLYIAWRGEQAFRHECFVLIVLVAVLVCTGASFFHWFAILVGWLFVMAVELLNSAVEKTCDLITKEYHPLIKAAKDMASAAIFVALVVNFALWIYVCVS